MLLQTIAVRLSATVAIACGTDIPDVSGLLSWEIQDQKTKSVWTFRMLTKDCFTFGWRPLYDILEDAFATRVMMNGAGDLDAHTDRNDGPDRSKMKDLVVPLFNALQDSDLPSCIHEELNNQFYPYDKRRQVLGAMAEAGLDTPYVLDCEPREELRDGAWELDERPRLVLVGTMDERHSRMYKGTALDGQKKPSENN
jgi:hypothetical protein